MEAIAKGQCGTIGPNTVYAKLVGWGIHHVLFTLEVVKHTKKIGTYPKMLSGRSADIAQCTLGERSAEFAL